MSFLKRVNNNAFKISVNNPDITFNNFLPINNKIIFDDYVSYLNKYIENGEAKDISTLRQERNGTLILYFHNLDFTVGLFTNNKGYVRYQILGRPARVINMTIDLDEDKKCFFERVEPINSLDGQLAAISKFVIFNKDKIHEL